MDSISPSTPVLSSPKLVPESPSIIATSKIQEASTLRLNEPEQVSAPSSSASPTDLLIARLEKELEISNARNSHLQRSLTESRRSCRESEQLLLRLQWDPKDDFYAFKNPAKNGSTEIKYLDKQELKMKNLIDQMRVMEKVIEETRLENETLKSQLEEEESEKASRSLSPVVSADPMDSPAMVQSSKKQRVKSPLAPQPNEWNRSPSASPAINSANETGKSPRWWLWKKLSPANSPSFWRATSPASPDSLNLNGSVSSPNVSSNSHGPSYRAHSQVEVGTPTMASQSVGSPAISHKSSYHTAIQASA